MFTKPAQCAAIRELNCKTNLRGTDDIIAMLHGFENHYNTIANTLHHLPADIYLLKVNNRSTRTRCEICSKLTKKIQERRHRSGVFFVNFEHISHHLTLNMWLPAGLQFLASTLKYADFCNSMEICLSIPILGKGSRISRTKTCIQPNRNTYTGRSIQHILVFSIVAQRTLWKTIY